MSAEVCCSKDEFSESYMKEILVYIGARFKMVETYFDSDGWKLGTNYLLAY